MSVRRQQRQGRVRNATGMSVWRGPFPFGRAKLLLSRTPVGSLDRAFRLEPRAFGRAKLLLSRIIRLSPTDLLSSPAGKLGRRLVTTHGSAGASPSRVWVVRLGGSLALPRWGCAARLWMPLQFLLFAAFVVKRRLPTAHYIWP